MRKSKIKFYLVIASISVILIGCGEKPQLPKENTKIIKYEKMNKKINKEEGVSNSDVQLKNNEILADVTIKNDMDLKKAKIIANKYANELKKQYKDTLVTVKIFNNKKVWVKEQIPAKDDEVAGQAKGFMNIEYVEINMRDLNKDDIKKILVNGKELDKKRYKIHNGELKIIKCNKKSNIQICTSNKKYKVVFLK